MAKGSKTDGSNCFTSVISSVGNSGSSNTKSCKKGAQYKGN